MQYTTFQAKAPQFIVGPKQIERETLAREKPCQASKRKTRPVMRAPLTRANNFSSREFSRKIPSLCSVSLAINPGASPAVAASLLLSLFKVSGKTVTAATENSRSNSVRQAGSSVAWNTSSSLSAKSGSPKMSCLAVLWFWGEAARSTKMCYLYGE